MDLNKCKPMTNSYMIEYVKRDHDCMHTHHYHDYFEIYYQLSGERNYFIKNRAYYVKKGDIVLINPYDLHKTVHVGSNTYERILINFDLNYLEPFSTAITDFSLLSCFDKTSPVLSLSIKDQLFIETLLTKMLRENEKKEQGFKTYSQISLIELLLFLGRLSPEQKNNYLEFPSSLHKKISEVTTFINEHFNEDFSLESIAQNFNMNTYYLCRTFKEVTGFHFTQYINAVRIRAGEKLLVDTDATILDIAKAIGYSNSTHFGRVFKAQLGLSPLQYRKIHTKKP